MNRNRRVEEAKYVSSALSKESMLKNGRGIHQVVYLSLRKKQRKIKRDASHIPVRKSFLSANSNEHRLLEGNSSNNPINLFL